MRVIRGVWRQRSTITAIECVTRGQQHLFADQLGRQEAFGLVWRWRKTQGRLVEAVNLSAIADTDTGYGNELNVVRTVRGYAALGGPHQG